MMLAPTCPTCGEAIIHTVRRGKLEVRDNPYVAFWAGLRLDLNQSELKVLFQLVRRECTPLWRLAEEFSHTEVPERSAGTQLSYLRKKLGEQGIPIKIVNHFGESTYELVMFEEREAPNFAVQGYERGGLAAIDSPPTGYWKGERLNLEPGMAKILFLLLRDITVSRLALEAENPTAGEHVLTVQVSRLRKVLRGAGVPHKIVATWGKGYTLDIPTTRPPARVSDPS